MSEAPEKKPHPWLAQGMKLLNSQAPELEVNLAAYAVGILACISWLSWWCFYGTRDANFVMALSAFLTAITGGLFKRGSQRPPQPPAAPPAPPDAGGAP